MDPRRKSALAHFSHMMVKGNEVRSLKVLGSEYSGRVGGKARHSQQAGTGA